MDITPNKRLSITYIHPKEAIIVDIAMGGGSCIIRRLFFEYNDTRRG